MPPLVIDIFLNIPVSLHCLSGLCGVIEQKDEGGQQSDSACGAQTQPGHAALCEYDSFIHYYLHQSFFTFHAFNF